MTSIRTLLALPFILVFASCATNTKHGDATLIDNSTTFSIADRPLDRLTFPEVSIGKIHTQIIRVRDLPQPIFPVSGNITIPKDEQDSSRHDQPWRTTRLKVELKSVSGEIFYDRLIDLSDDGNGNRTSWHKVESRPIRIEITPWGRRSSTCPKLTSYDIVIHVTSASLRSTDTLNLDRLVVINPQK